MNTDSTFCGRRDSALNRRDFLLRSGAGFGALALIDLLNGSSLQAVLAEKDLNPLAPKQGQHKARAKSVIFLFMEGGPSHMDLFDPKPLLNELAGKPIPPSFGRVITAMGEFDSPILGSGAPTARPAAWIRLKTHAGDGGVSRHPALLGRRYQPLRRRLPDEHWLHPRRPSEPRRVDQLRPRHENQNLPAFVVMQDNAATVVNGPRNWGAGFMPAVFQGTRITAGSEPIPNLNTPEGVSDVQQRGKLDFLNALNREHAASRQLQTELEARIASYELAFRMQAEAPEAVDMSKETEATKALYGFDEKDTAEFGRMCLLSRRLVERGVRFVQLYHGAGSKWDSHAKLEENHGKLCRGMDQPVAGLLRDESPQPARRDARRLG